MFERTRERTKKTFRYVKDDVVNVKEIQGHFRDVKDLAGEHLDPRRKKVGRTETFANAMERQNLTPADVAASYKHYSFRFYLFLFFGSFTLFIFGWSLLSMDWFVAAPAFAATLIFLAQTFNASFRCFQIRHHEFLPVSTWVQRRDQWWPAEYLPPRSASSKTLRKKDL